MESAVSSKPSILVVDDQRATYDLINIMLRPLAMDVSAAETGENALMRLDGHRPDLIVVDLMTPLPGYCDALELVACLSESPTLRDIPVIIFTAHTCRLDHRLRDWPAQVVAVVDKARLRPAEFRALVQSNLTRH